MFVYLCCPGDELDIIVLPRWPDVLQLTKLLTQTAEMERLIEPRLASGNWVFEPHGQWAAGLPIGFYT